VDLTQVQDMVLVEAEEEQVLRDNLPGVFLKMLAMEEQEQLLAFLGRL
jgi:hypothetical protein